MPLLLNMERMWDGDVQYKEVELQVRCIKCKPRRYASCPNRPQEFMASILETQKIDNGDLKFTLQNFLKEMFLNSCASLEEVYNVYNLQNLRVTSRKLKAGPASASSCSPSNAHAGSHSFFTWSTNSQHHMNIYHIYAMYINVYILYYIILYYIIFYYIVLYHIISYHMILYCIVLYYIILYYIILSCLISYYIILYYVILYCMNYYEFICI